MASVRSTIELIITGSTRGLNAASAEARRMAERVAAAEDRVSDARRRSAEAEGRVADVEARLAGARAQHTAALSQMGVAETNLAQVRNANQGALSNLGQAEADLQRLRASGTATLVEIDDAEQRITRTRVEADQANQNLQRAEAQLERARGRAAQTGGNIAALEERLAQARGNAFRASEDLARAENNLNGVRRRGTDDMNRQRSGILGIFDAFSRLTDAFSGADGASTSLLSKLGALNSVITSIGGPIVQAVAGLAEFAAIMGLIVEIVGVVGGVLGQALAGIPALLFAIGAAAGTVFLGLDGIKKAAEVMQPAFDKLKAAVSDTFEKALTPAFREIAGLIPKLTSGFTGIATAISGLVSKVTSFLASAQGVKSLQVILAGTAQFVNGLGDGIRNFIVGLTTAAAAAAPAMRTLGSAIGAIFGQLGEVFTRLSNNGVINAAVLGLAATIKGLADVIAPVVELLIRMGAALGTSLGTALTSLGAGIQQVIPFFEKLAQVAGNLLVEAVKQLGPPLTELVNSILPGAAQGLDGFAAVVTNVVLPAIAGFIDWLRTDGIPGFISFTQGLIVAGLEFASTMVGIGATILGVFQSLFAALALIPGPFQQQFAQGAAVLDAYKGKLTDVKTTIDGMKNKVISVQLKTQGAELIKGIQDTVNKISSKVVTVTANAFGKPENDALRDSIAGVLSKATTTISNVFGKPENDLLTGAIAAVPNKTTTTLSNVFGEQENRNLRSAIDAVINKTVEVRANVSGEAAVRSLVGAINAVHDASSTITTYLRTVTQRFASGGRVPTGDVSFLVGENGPELLSLDALGGMVTPAARTRQILAGNRARSGSTATSVAPGGGGEPMVIENHIEIGGEVVRVVRSEISARDRATKRTVLAGSGVTF